MVVRVWFSVVVILLVIVDTRLPRANRITTRGLTTLMIALVLAVCMMMPYGSSRLTEGLVRSV